MSELRMIELRGASGSMGECFGEHFREGVRDLSRSRMDHLVEFVRKHDPARNLSRAAVLDAARRTVEAHQRFDPPTWEEFEGIARAAGLGVEELLIGNGYTDFRDFVLLEGQAPGAAATQALGECTALLAPAECADGRPIVGQTWDMNADAAEFLVIVHRKPDDWPETLGLTTVGCLCLIGMNSEGVSVGNTNLVPTDVRAGVNYLFTITNALRRSSAEGAAAAVEAAPRLSGHNYYAADERTVINIETTARQARRTVVAKEVFIHANHYLDEGLKSLELGGQDLRNSNWRQDTLAGRFEEAGTPVTMDTAWEQLAHVTQDKVEVGNVTKRGGATLATVVQCPARRAFHICAGGPDTGHRQVLAL